MPCMNRTKNIVFYPDSASATHLALNYRENYMKRNIAIIIASIMAFPLVNGCTSKKTKMQNKEMAATSDARVSLTKKYEECVSKAGSDKAAIEACDAILESKQKLE